MSKRYYEFTPIYKCRNCQEIVGTMGELYHVPKMEQGYEIGEEDALERLEKFCGRTHFHKGCRGVCEVIRFERKD